MNIAFLGLGLMGRPMAQRLAEAGHTVHAWNRTAAKAQDLAAACAQGRVVVCHTPADAARHAELLITMLEDGKVVGDVLFHHGAADGLPRGSLVIDMSSIQPVEAKQHAEQLAERGVAHVDAPVSGGTLGAEAGTLAIMAGGGAEDFARALPVLNTFGRATHVGPSGSGQLAKLANQMIVGITIGAVAEALLLCQQGGADPALVRQALMGGFADSRILQVHGERMVQRDFAPRGRMTVQLKDMNNALHTADLMGFEAPITELVQSLYADAVALGIADFDQSALFKSLAMRNGLN